MDKCTGMRCPMQAGFKVNECNYKECHHRTEPITRADRIRAMSDEELAEFLRFGLVPSHICFICGNTVSECNDIACRRAVLYWLQQPSGEGTV